jgi:nitrogen fixation NifU-like protein
MLAEILPGMTREQVERLSEVFRRMIHGEDPPADLELGDLEALHGVAKFPVRVKCALLPWLTLKEALRAWGDGQDAPSKATSTEEPREEKPR